MHWWIAVSYTHLIEVEKKEAEVSEEEITAEIDKAREANSRLITIEDRATEAVSYKHLSML